MMVARIVWSKGVKEFIEASTLVSQTCPNVRFLLVGPLDPGSPDEIPSSYVEQHLSPHFTWLGFQQDVKSILALADIVTLPSYYQEGIPRVLLEAMAMQKPIITTDNVGCREVVDDGMNGFLVPTQNVMALASAIQTLVKDESCRLRFGLHSRRKVQAEFDESLITEEVLTKLYKIDY
jgi:N,N'-diacetylbacillosaminyl-diphospho-undecaprenol alpha-1,3-N-acetylgalactosaminyltransferase